MKWKSQIKDFAQLKTHIHLSLGAGDTVKHFFIQKIMNLIIGNDQVRKYFWYKILDKLYSYEEKALKF